MNIQLMKFRKAAGYSNRDTFANKIGVNKYTYRSWESGAATPNAEQVCMCADALGCTPNDIVGWYEDHPDDKPETLAFADERQRRLNEDFALLDDASRDAAAAAVRGMAVACARGCDPAGSEADILSA